MSVSQPILIAKEVVSAKNLTAMHKKLSVALSWALLAISVQAWPSFSVYEDFDNDSNEQMVALEETDILEKLRNLLAPKKVPDARTASSTGKSVAEKENTKDDDVKKTYNIKDLMKFYKVGGLYDKNVREDADHYVDRDALAAGIVGEYADEKKKFRNGSKTRGFHRVHHKDEYKRDKEFYEDLENSGNIRKFKGGTLGFVNGAGDEYHKGRRYRGSEKGIFGKRGYSDEGYWGKKIRGLANSAEIDGSF